MTKSPWDRMKELQERAEAQIQQAIAMRDLTAETRLRIWSERLTDARSGPLATGLERAVDAARSVTFADCANVQLLHPRASGLVLRAHSGFQQPFLDYFEFVEDSDTACGVAWRNRKPVVVDDVTASPIFRNTEALDVLRDAGVHAVKSAPLIGRAGTVLGVLSVHYKTPPLHVDSDLTRLLSLARHVAAMIDQGPPPQENPR